MSIERVVTKLRTGYYDTDAPRDLDLTDDQFEELGSELVNRVIEYTNENAGSPEAAEQDRLTRDEFNELSQRERRMFLQNGGELVDSQ